MRKYILGAIALAVVVAAATAVPAFTAASGTVTMSITAQPAAEPCIELLDPPGTQINFGTVGFSVPNQLSQKLGDVDPRLRNCSSADEAVLIKGDDATAPSAIWQLVVGSAVGVCSAPNLYALLAQVFGGSAVWVGKVPGPFIASAASGATRDFQLNLVMPCAGSAGAGQTFATSVVLTATAL